MVNDQYSKLSKNITTDKWYMKAKYEICAD